MQIAQVVMMSIFGNQVKYFDSYLLLFGRSLIILQLTFHIPLIYYVGKEHILQSLDEIKNYSLSQMVDRIKQNSSTADPRNFRLQRQYEIIKEQNPRNEIEE